MIQDNRNCIFNVKFSKIYSHSNLFIIQNHQALKLLEYLPYED